MTGGKTTPLTTDLSGLGPPADRLTGGKITPLRTDLGPEHLKTQLIRIGCVGANICAPYISHR